MWNSVFQRETVVVISALVSFWVTALGLLIFFAVRKRSARAKVLSLVIPVGVAVINLAICATAFAEARTYFFISSHWLGSLFIATLALAFVSLSVFTALTPAHLIAGIFRNEQIVYGLSAVVLFVSPLVTGADLYFESRRNAIEAASITRATERTISLCCNGNAASCRETAAAFDKLFDVKGRRGFETDMRNKYLGQACRYGTKEDCDNFNNAVGTTGDGYKENWLYQQACDESDLYREPPLPDDYK